MNGTPTTATTDIAADYSVTPTQLGNIITAMIAADRPTMIWGPPGVAKSAVCEQKAAAHGMHYIDERPMLRDPVDYRGIPYLDEAKRTLWGQPGFLPDPASTDGFFLNLEELSAAPPANQASLYQLVWDRMLGDYRLPPGVRIFATGNRVSDRGVAYRMPTPLVSRFMHLEVIPDVTGWCAWAAMNHLAPEVIFFMQVRPELHHVFDPKDAEITFPCPRTWHMVSDYITAAGGMLSPAEERAVIRGMIGAPAAIEFCAFLEVWRSIVHPRAIIGDPHGAPLPEKADHLLATCGALYRLADMATFDAIVTYAERFPRPEVAEFLIQSCIKHDADLMRTGAYIRWAALNQA